jgi:hypothetical protein
MRKIARVSLALALTSAVLFSGCSNSPKLGGQNAKTSDQSRFVQPATSQGTANQGSTQNSSSATQATADTDPAQAQIDLSKVMPNENGKIMVVMFHNFVEKYKSGDKQFTTTFGDFRKLLQTLYDEGYRLISLSDLINNNISVPAGYIPIVFSFDDGTSGQFNLVENDGRLVSNSQSAVGIMEEFNKTHPDFGLKGTFYVNLDLGTFQGEGTVEERLNYLIDKGFEIGNHTLTHVHLNEIKSADIIQKEIGGNQKKMNELIPGYVMKTFSLPYGQPAKALQGYVAKGEFEGAKYENLAIVEVGWDPSVSPVNRKFNPLSVHRVRASGIEPVDADLAWWLKELSRKEQYVSDGNPDTVTVPKEKESSIDTGRLGNKKLVIY